MGSNNQRQFNTVVVIERRDGTKRLEQFSPGIGTTETNDSKVSGQTLAEIKKLVKTQEMIISTDPGHNGGRIRRLVANTAPNAKQAFITCKEGEPIKRGNSLGVKHASKETLVRVLDDLHEIQAVGSDITKEKYNDLGLAISPEARLLREKVGIKLEIGCGSSKQFLKRLKMFGITHKELRRAVEDAKRYAGC